MEEIVFILRVPEPKIKITLALASLEDLVEQNSTVI